MRWQSHQSFRDPCPIQRPAPRGTQPMLADLTQNSHPSVPYGCLGRGGSQPPGTGFHTCEQGRAGRSPVRRRRAEDTTP